MHIGLMLQCKVIRDEMRRISTFPCASVLSWFWNAGYNCSSHSHESGILLLAASYSIVYSMSTVHSFSVVLSQEANADVLSW